MRFEFDRYRGKQIMAQGVTIIECKTLSGARKKAYRILRNNPDTCRDTLKLRRK